MSIIFCVNYVNIILFYERIIVLTEKKDFVFLTKSDNLMNVTAFNYELKKVVEKYNETSEYKIDKISAHTLRHTGCTRNAEDGMDIKVLQYLMGPTPK